MLDDFADVSIYTAKILGHLPSLHFIAPARTMFSRLRSTSLPDGVLFQTWCNGFQLQAEFKDGQFTIFRNGRWLAINLRQYPGAATLSFGWSPTSLTLGLMPWGPASWKDVFAVLQTDFTLPSNRLVRWHQEKEYQKSALTTAADVSREIAECFMYVETRVVGEGAHKMFWNTARKPFKPKKEPEVTAALYALLDKLPGIQRIRMERQLPTGVGAQDFFFSATLTDGRQVDVCCEVKHAHSGKLHHGLTTQLTDYMRSRGTEYGIFVVIDFGPEFPVGEEPGLFPPGTPRIDPFLALQFRLPFPDTMQVVWLRAFPPPNPSKATKRT